MMNFSFQSANSVVCASGASTRLPEYCQQLAISKPLLVSDPGIVRAGILAPIVDNLRRALLETVVFADVQADPPESVILAAVAAAQAAGCDGVIAVGGGSAMDTAKLVALLLGSGQPLAEVYGVNVARGPRLPLILVPTTAGTGSEVTAVAIVTTGATTKTGVVSPHLFPDIALLDAELTLGLPANVTAETGVDAMVHAIEAYTSVLRKNPYSDMLAKQALQLLNQHIEPAYHHGEQLLHREQMLLGACLAGQAFANAPVAAVHALAYPLGGHYHLAHGLSNALVLIAVMRFNAPVCARWYAELAQVLLPSLQGSDADRCDALIAHLQALLQRLAIPSRLRDLGIPEADLPMLAADALKQQRLLMNNPRPVCYDDALAIYQFAY